MDYRIVGVKVVCPKAVDVEQQEALKEIQHTNPSAGQASELKICDMS